MPRTRKVSGQNSIDHARELFERSVKVGRPDYRYVVLAIGAAPIAPPRWAILACIAAKEREELLPPSFVNAGQIGLILDELVRFYDREQQHRRAQPHLDSKPSSLRSALIAVCGQLGIDPGKAGADDSWLRSARRAWEREQNQDRRQSHLELDGWCVTGRIERVLLAIQGPEFGYPSDPIKELWLREHEGSGQEGAKPSGRR